MTKRSLRSVCRLILALRLNASRERIIYISLHQSIIPNHIFFNRLRTRVRKISFLKSFPIDAPPLSFHRYYIIDDIINA